MRALPLFLVLLMPVSAQDAAQALPSGNILREWRGETTGIRGEAYHVVRDADAWKQLWKDHAGSDAPKVDFRNEMVVAVFAAGAYELNWMRITQLGKPGLSRCWIGLCPVGRKSAYHIAVMPRSNLAIDFWLKVPGLVAEAGKELERGGKPIDARLVQGGAAVWSRVLPALSAEEKNDGADFIALMESGALEDRDQGSRGLLRLGAKSRSFLEPLAASQDLEVRTRAVALLEQIPTFDAKALPVTREQALFAVREHLSLTLPDQFANEPGMRWEDDTVRYSAGPHWEVKLRYL